jgi:hypothetical protein
MKIYGAQLTGSIASTGNPVVTGSLTVSGNLTAQQFIVSSSVTFLTTSFSSGSTRFGDSSDDNHNFTGSVLMTGSLTVVTTGNEFQVNAGGVNIGNALTDNHVISGSVRINPNGLFVSSSGNVLIGNTIGDGYRLQIVGSNQATSTFGQTYVGVAAYSQWISGSNAFVMGFDGAAGTTARMTITGTGNVGIGTTTPSTKLEVSDATNAVIKVSATSDGAQAALSLNGYASGGVYRASRLNFQQAGTNKWSILQDYNQDNTNSLTFEQAGTRRVVFDASGNVGIGNNTPSVKLDVSGQIKFSSIASTDYSISFSGIGAGAWYNLTAVNFSGFMGLVTINISNGMSNYGYYVQASAWIFQQGINGEGVYSGIRSVTIRPDGTSQEGFNVVESYHTAPTSGRYNMRMRLVYREASLGAENPLNLQIWVDHINGINANAATLSLKAI